MRWIWTIFILLIVVGFAVLEGYALSHPDGLSLSQYLWDASVAWPPLPFVLGNLTGGLAVHLWWHWVPAGVDRPDRG